MAYNQETGMWEGYIYKIWNDVNNLLYIGQTSLTIQIRFKQHIQETKKPNCDLHRAMQKYGVNHFFVEQLDKISCQTENERIYLLNELEKYYIKKFNTFVCGYNMTIGGEYTGNTWEEVEVIQYDLFCNQITIYHSITEASRITNVSRSDISFCCAKNGKIYSAGGYIWRYINQPLKDEEKQELIQRYDKRIKQYDYYGNLIKIFNNPTEAVLYLHTNPKNIGNITGSCKGRGGACGFIWRYYNDSFDKYPIPKFNKKVEQRDIKDGHLINTYKDCVEAAKAINGDKSSINLCCLKYFKQSQGYIWCYQGDDYFLKKEKPICRYSKNNEYIDEFPSIKVACQETNIGRNNIRKVLNHKAKTAGNYIWKYKDDILKGK